MTLLICSDISSLVIHLLTSECVFCEFKLQFILYIPNTVGCPSTYFRVKSPVRVRSYPPNNEKLSKPKVCNTVHPDYNTAHLLWYIIISNPFAHLWVCLLWVQTTIYLVHSKYSWVHLQIKIQLVPISTEENTNTAAEHKLDFELTKDNQYIVITGKLWGIILEYLWAKLQCFNDPTL